MRKFNRSMGKLKDSGLRKHTFGGQTYMGAPKAMFDAFLDYNVYSFIREPWHIGCTDFQRQADTRL